MPKANKARRGFGTIKPSSGNKDNVKLDELVDTYSFSKDAPDQWVEVRFTPHSMLPIKQHWVKILTKDKKETKILKMCLRFNPDDEQNPHDKECPYCELSGGQNGSAQHQTRYLANAIIRDYQEDEPRKKQPHTKKEKETGYKDVKSKSWTPIRVINMPNGLAKTINDLTELNKVKKKSGTSVYPVSDAEYGCDVSIKFDSKASGGNAYSVQKGERTPLTEEEEEYLAYDLEDADEILDMLGREDEDQAAKEFKRMNIIGATDLEDDEDDDDDDDDIPLGGKKKSKKSRRSAYDVDDEDDEDEDEEDRPRRKKKTSGKSKPKKRSSAFDDDEDDDDDEPPFEEDRPRRKKKSSKTSSRKSSTKKTSSTTRRKRRK